ncbi:hypothetical protein V6N12_011553 [Hibiscus sabdariffa]|uniref:Uncharacterized protein n=1 Tax=Hibiscus sabdariffa TaxID=183260 RepID=A0ABR2B099_9ROSI
MVNKQDVINRGGNPLGCWEAENENLSDAFYHNYLHDSSKIYTEQSYNMLTRANGFNTTGSDDIDDIDLATSDSSEPDLLWQFNKTKLSNITNGIESKIKKPTSKLARNPEMSKNLHHMTGPSPSRKLPTGVGQPLHRNMRQSVIADGKRKTGVENNNTQSSYSPPLTHTAAHDPAIEQFFLYQLWFGAALYRLPPENPEFPNNSGDKCAPPTHHPHFD